MINIYDAVLSFKNAYPKTVGWRYRKHCEVVEKHLNPGENVEYAFIAQKNDNPINLFQTCVVALTNERILIGRKRLLFGYNLDSVTPDLFNDLKVVSNIIWGKVYIDTIKEFITLSNIDKRALPEIETVISSFMMEQKKKYPKMGNKKVNI